MPKGKPDIDKLAADRAIFLLDEAKHFVMNLQHYWQQGELEPGQCVYVTYDGKRAAGVYLYRNNRAPVVLQREIQQLDKLVKLARLLKTWADNEEAREHDADLSEAVLLARDVIGTLDLVDTRGE